MGVGGEMGQETVLSLVGRWGQASSRAGSALGLLSVARAVAAVG